MTKKKTHVGYDWTQVVHRATQAAQRVFIDEIRKERPSNPRSPTYSRDVSDWQALLNIPKMWQIDQIKEIRNIHKKVGNQSVDNAKIEQVLKELAAAKAEAGKEHEALEAVKKDYEKVTKKYEELKLKSKSRK